MPEAFLLLLLVFAALPAALSVAEFPEAVLLSPFIASLTATATWLASVHMNLPVGFQGLTATGAMSALVLVVPRTRRIVTRRFRGSVKPYEWGVLTLTGLMFGFLSLRTAPPTAWDARYIWLARGRWYLNEPERITDLLTTDRVFAHPDYPPLVPATLSTLWNLLPDADPSLGVTAITLLSVSALGLAALLLARLVSTTQTSKGALLASATVLLVGSLGADGLINDGYVDVLLAGLLLAAVADLVNPHRGPVPTLLVLVACMAMLKQEGLIFGAVLIAVSVPVARRRKVVLAAATLALASGIWQMSLEKWGVPSTSASAGVPSRITELLRPDSQAWSLVGDLLTGDYRNDILGLLALGAISLVVTRLSSTQNAYSARLIALSGSLTSVILLGGYILGDFRDDLDWWFPASFSRISAFPVLAASASLAFIGVGFLNERPTGTRPVGSKE